MHSIFNSAQYYSTGAAGKQAALPFSYHFTYIFYIFFAKNVVLFVVLFMNRIIK